MTFTELHLVCKSVIKKVEYQLSPYILSKSYLENFLYIRLYASTFKASLRNSLFALIVAPHVDKNSTASCRKDPPCVPILILPCNSMPEKDLVCPSM